MVDIGDDAFAHFADDGVTTAMPPGDILIT